MKRFLTLLALAFATIFSAVASIEPPINLKVDYNTEPLGLDNPMPMLSWEVGDRSRGAVQSAYRVLISSSPENLAADNGDIWDTKKVMSDETFQIAYEGKALQSRTRYFWKVQTWDEEGEASAFSVSAWFETGLLNASDWEGDWIGDGNEPPEKPEDFYERIPAPLFRKGFEADKSITKARLYISGLGYYEAFLNGKKVGDHYLDPGWTQYGKTVYYCAYDVTDHLQQGDNALGVMLGNGWYNPLPMDLFGRWNLREILTIGQPKVRAQLHIEYADGSSETIKTDRSWKTADGPIVRNNVYLGEWYDARLEQEGWEMPTFDDKDWKKAAKVDAPPGELKWQFVPPIRHTRTVKPVSIHKTEDGKYIFDLGQNFAGVIRYRVEAPEGTELIFRYSELLDPDGTMDFRTTAATQIKEGGIVGGPGAPKTAWQEDRYFCKGDGVEVFEPKFTFHGFRYVEVDGLPEAPSLNDLEGLRLNSDIQKVSSFRCSEELFNRVQDIAEWAMLSNVFSIESDCPAREKFGYGGDIVTAGETYIYNYDMANFYTKTARDFARDARENGGMTECAPDIGINARGLTDDTGPVGWTLAHPFVLEQLYEYYGRKDILIEQYQPLKALVDFYRERVPDHIIMDGIGDHVSIDERPRPVTSTAFYYDHARILSKIAGILGKEADQATYAELAEDIKQAFIEKFVNKETGEVFTRTQACQVFALYYGLLPEGLERKAQDVLKEEIYLKHRGHLSTGIFSTKMMLEYLHNAGMDRVAYDMMSQKEFPSYGYWLDNGATTLWENWAFKKNDSKNHPMFGSISEWFHKGVLGIEQTEGSVGFKEIVIKPAIVGNLTSAEGHYHSVRGNIRSKWWKFGDDLFLEVEIPANTTAQVYLPVSQDQPRAMIQEGDITLVEAGEGVDNPHEHVQFVSKNRSHYHFEVGAGKYRFVVR